MTLQLLRHMWLLVELLEEPLSCYRCPYWEHGFYHCTICRVFVGVHAPEIREHGKSYCPCHFLGADEAVKQTWLRLEEYGYI